MIVDCHRSTPFVLSSRDATAYGVPLVKFGNCFNDASRVSEALMTSLKMFSMENLDLDAVNRQFFFESGPFLNSSGNSNGSTSGSTNSGDLFLYDENSSDSVGSTYSFNSDQENNAESKE